MIVREKAPLTAGCIPSGRVVASPALSGSRSLDDGGSVDLGTRDDHHGLASCKRVEELIGDG